MRNLNTVKDLVRRCDLERRIYGRLGDSYNGVFDMGGLRIIASNGEGWDHVSVSHQMRTPTWTEMQDVFRACFLPTETVVQFHVPHSDHIDVHPHCLHLWRCQSTEFPRPPAHMV